MRNLFLDKLEKETTDATMKGISNLCRLEKDNKAIRDRLTRTIKNIFRLEKGNREIKNRKLTDIRNLFEHEHEEENYYIPLGVGDFWSNNYIGYKSNDNDHT